MDFGYVQIVIYNKNRITIPVLRRRDAYLTIAVGTSLYEELKRVPDIEVYTADEDKLRRERLRLTKENQGTRLEVPGKVASNTVSKGNNTETDRLIEERLKELPEEKEKNEIVLNEKDLKEIALSSNGFKKYEELLLRTMTKKQMKEILNVERGFPPGHKYYGSYHDGVENLIKNILNSQK
jgi:hypothetical protein